MLTWISNRNAWIKWSLVVAVWTLIGLSFASQFYISSSKMGRPVSWGHAVYYSLFDWYVFALLSFPVVWLARRFRIERGQWQRSVSVHLLASAGFSLLYIVLRAVVAQGQGWLSRQPVTFSEAFQPLLVKTFHFSLLIYWVIVSVNHAFDYYRQAQERELHTAELERRLAEARLQALQMQLNPHFLFNTLHTISALMHKDVEAADRMITRLSDLLRYALESTDEQEVTLQQELAFLRDYLEIEQTRFGDRLAVRMDIAPETLEAQVPNLILQPLLENAIRHGVEPQARPGVIELRAQNRNGQLHLELRDNGQGLPPDLEEGVGLSNTRARLEHLYGQAHRFELANAAAGGLVVRVIIPFRIRSGA
ncbi:MAG: histidine kinase [Chloroflexi bacterium]|nr:histidine kinase [Chloroflexota bacterium]